MTTMKRQAYNAMVKRPGKFEGEQPWCPYFWDMLLEGGFSDYENEDGSATVGISPDDVKLFPELADCDTATLKEDDNGFVYCTVGGGEGG